MLTPLSVAAGGFDGSVPLICAAADTVECDVAHECTQGPPWEVNLPIFLEIDFDKKEVVSIDALDKDRTSKILVVTKLDGLVTAVGAEGAYAWSLAVTEDTGMMTLTLAGKEHGFIVRGACNPK
jgi:hypothetical protein